MIAAFIGISLGIVLILMFHFIKSFDKTLVYGLILTAIGFIYVGFSWTSLPDLIITIIQAVIFLMISYFGITKNFYLIAFGYFFHGIWDVAFAYFKYADIVPPHYDIFCIAIDFTMGIYLVFLKVNQKQLSTHH